jgi:hypothetical protein
MPARIFGAAPSVARSPQAATNVRTAAIGRRWAPLVVAHHLLVSPRPPPPSPMSIGQVWPSTLSTIGASSLHILASLRILSLSQSCPESVRLILKILFVPVSRTVLGFARMVAIWYGQMSRGIYTHSIPWSVLGKDEAKRQYAARTLSGHWSDTLDKLVRRPNGDQTAGIPVGPDTSLVIAETLLASVDAHISRAHPRVNGLRYLDDYEFVTSTKEEAESVLSTLQSALRIVELELNNAKSSVCELRANLTEPWVSSLRRQPIDRSKPSAQHEDLSSYFDIVFKTMKEFPDEQILKYAIGRTSRMTIHEDNLPFFEHLLQQCVSADPGCLPQVGADIEFYRQNGYTINATWTDVLNRVIVRQLRSDNANEVAWALSLLLQFRLPMASDAALEVEKTDDSVVALLAAMLAANNLTSWSSLAGLKGHRRWHRSERGSDHR